MQKEEQTKQILLIEDDRALRTILTERLRDAGYVVIEADNGEEGLHMALENKPDLTMLDMIMPKMDGIEMLGALRDDSWGKNARVIVLTNIGDKKKQKQAETFGIEEYLKKSDWDIEAIVKRVSEVFV